MKFCVAQTYLVELHLDDFLEVLLGYFFTFRKEEKKRNFLKSECYEIDLDRGGSEGIPRCQGTP